MRTRLPLVAILVAGMLGLASCGGSSVCDELPTTTLGPPTDDEAFTELTLVAGDVTYDVDSLEADFGEIEFTLVSDSPIEHTLLVECFEDSLNLLVNEGETVVGSIRLAPGTYSVYCDIPGHREAGMEASLVVNPLPGMTTTSAADGATTTSAADGVTTTSGG